MLDVLTREENDFDESASFWSQGMTSAGGDASGKVVSRIRREIELDRRLRSQHVVVARRARGGETWRGVVFVFVVSVSDRNDETLDSHESEIFARRSGIAARRRVDGGERVRSSSPRVNLPIASSSTNLSPLVRRIGTRARLHRDSRTSLSPAVPSGSLSPRARCVAVAAPERRVVALVGDGSAHYAIQALWTQAREGLDVVTVVMNNAKYQILELELAIQGVAAAAKNADKSRDRSGWIS